MAQNNPGLLEDLIADGRVFTRPVKHYGNVTVITVNLELMHATMTSTLTALFTGDYRLQTCFGGTQQITNATTSMVDYLCGQVYNRLRAILESKAPDQRVARMNTRCPIPNWMEFPAWISSTLSRIGPCRITDGPLDALVVYATAANTMNNYGRTNPVDFDVGGYTQIMDVLREINVRMAPFDDIGIQGSYYPTIAPAIAENVWTLYGTVHQAHYEPEDTVRIAFLTSPLAQTPFEKVGMTIGYVDDKAAVAALAAVAAPANTPAGQDADSAGRPVGHIFDVNYFGIKPAIAAVGTTPAVARGIYVIGRGLKPYYQCILAQQISVTEVLGMLRERIFHTT